MSAILLKRNPISGSIPTTSSLSIGEVALNIGPNDGTLYFMNASSSISPIRAGSASYASFATTASYALNGGGGTVVTASYAITASYALTSNTNGGIATSASYALTASYALNGNGAINSSLGSFYDHLPETSSIKLKSWYRADLGLTFDGNNRISSWADLSGNGNNLIAPLTSSRPIQTGSLNFNNQKVVRFAATNSEFMSASVIVNSASASIFIVYQRRQNTYGGVLSAATTNGSDTGSQSWLIDTLLNNGQSIQWFKGGILASFADLGQVPQITDLVVDSLFYRTYYFNDQKTIGSSTSMTNVTNELWLGCRKELPHGPSFYNSIDVAEILIYDGAVSYYERQWINYYLSKRYQMNF